MAAIAARERPDDDYVAKLGALAAWHYEWALGRVDGAAFDPEGQGADYNQHYVDLEADDDEFHTRAREIMGLPPLTGE